MATYTRHPRNSPLHEKLLREAFTLRIERSPSGRPGHVRILRVSGLATTRAYDGHRDLIPTALRAPSRTFDPDGLLTRPDTSD